MTDFIGSLLMAGGGNAAPFIMLGLYIAMMVIIAVITHKKSSSLNSFFLANRGLGGWMTAFAYGTTYFSSVVLIGYAGKFGMSMGLSTIWIGVANGLIGALLAWLVLAKRTRNMTRVLDTKTMPEFFETRYQNPKIKLISAIVIFIFLIPYSTSVYQGLGYLFESIFGLDFVWCIVIIAVFTALYLFSGGYFATALSDFIQGIIMIAGIALMLGLMISSDTVKGIEGFRTLSETGYGFFPSYEAASGRFIDSPGFNLIIIILLTSFGIWAVPQSVHKFYAIKDDNAIKKGIIISTIFCLIISTGAYLNGGFARLFFPEALPADGVDSVVPGMFEQAGFSKAVLGFIMILVLAASMSTLSSLSLCGASAVAIDAYKGYIKKDATEKQVKVFLRILCLAFVAVSAILAIFKVDAIVTLMSLSWGTLAGCFLGPYLLGLYSKKITSAAAMTSIISGLGLTVILIIVFGATTPGVSGFKGIISSGISRAPLIGIITMAFSMIITYVVSLFTKKPEAKHLEKCFSRYEEPKL